MNETTPRIRHPEDIEFEDVSAAEGMSRGVLLDDSHGAPNFALRRFKLAPNAQVPKHTNSVEHEQYVLAGEYIVGLADREYTVKPGDTLLIPAGTVHWYRNESSDPGEFLCAVPLGEDTMELLEDSDTGKLSD